MNGTEVARIMSQLANLMRDLQRLLNSLHFHPLTDLDAGDTEQADLDDWLFPELRDSL